LEEKQEFEYLLINIHPTDKSIKKISFVEKKSALLKVVQVSENCK